MKRKDKFYLIIILIAGFTFGLYYLGIIQDVQINEQEIGPLKVVYETYLGDYSNTGEIRDRIYSSLIADGINSTKSFGVYYDNPKEVKKSRLRSETGVIIEEADYSRIMELKGKYNVKDVPKVKNIVTTFPYHGDISIWLGVFKVYPKLNSYIEEKNYKQSPVMEIYDTENNLIIYLFEIVR